MANNCYYQMRVKGKKESIEELFTVMKDYNHIPHFWRVFSAEMADLEIEDDGSYTTDIVGDCAWSVHTCMRDGLGSYANDCPDESTSLLQESKRLKLEIEVFAEESGIGFQEHYHYDCGKEIAAEETEYLVYDFDEDDYDAKTREEAFAMFLKECELVDQGFTLNSLRFDGALVIGGFKNYCDFSF